jgi:hypothetical protein
VTPGEQASEAAAIASAWIARSPSLLDVLAWHRGLCEACTPSRSCGERGEIIAEYGAGPYGSAVFYPAAEGTGLP